MELKCKMEEARKLPFDEVAPAAICFHADLMYCKKPKAIEAFKHIAKRCKVPFKEVKEDNFGWGIVYNEKFREIAEDEGFEDFYIDHWGAKCVRGVPDYRGGTTDMCGDDNGYFPWYEAEIDLRNRLRG